MFIIVTYSCLAPNSSTLSSLVVKALTPMDGDRTCYRMTGGVITQRTVKEVLPAVQKNLEGIEALIKSLVEQLKAAEKEAEEFRVQHNIRFQRAAPAGSSGAGSSESSSGEQASGILI